MFSNRKTNAPIIIENLDIAKFSVFSDYKNFYLNQDKFDNI